VIGQGIRAVRVVPDSSAHCNSINTVLKALQVPNLRGMVRDYMGNLVAQHSSDTILIFTQRQDARKDEDLTTTRSQTRTTQSRILLDTHPGMTKAFCSGLSITFTSHCTSSNPEPLT
jgi:hypothetical protein